MLECEVKWALGSIPMNKTSGGDGTPEEKEIFWFALGLIGLISFMSKGLSRVFSNTTVQKHQFFGAQPSLWSNSHIHTWLLEKP